MPDGRVTKFDPNVGHGLIETSSGRFVVAADDIEPKARKEGVMVTFDVTRDDPHDRAVNVALREGTRTAQSQGRLRGTGKYH